MMRLNNSVRITVKDSFTEVGFLVNYSIGISDSAIKCVHQC